MTLATAAKVAASVLTNEKLRKTVDWIIAGILSPLIVLLVIVCSSLSGGATKTRQHSNCPITAARLLAPSQKDTVSIK